MFERFDDHAQRALALANEEAARFRHEYIGTEHILLGIIKEAGGRGARILTELTVDLAAILGEVEQMIRPGPDKAAPAQAPHVPRAKAVIERAIQEARTRRTPYVGTEHLLLALLLIPDCIAAKVLAGLGVRADAVRERVDQLTREAALESDALHFVAGMPLSAAACTALLAAGDEARKHAAQMVDLQHILLAMLLEKEGPAAEILREHGLMYEKLQERLRGPGGTV